MIDLGRASITRLDRSNADGWFLHIELFGLVLNIMVAR